MKQLLTIFLTMFLVQTLLAQQKNVTIQAENAAEEFAKLSGGEYNIVVKGDLKGKNEWKNELYYDCNDKPMPIIGLWKVGQSVEINVLDLSEVTGLDSIKDNIVLHKDYHIYLNEDEEIIEEPEWRPQHISLLILPDNLIFFNNGVTYFHNSCFNDKLVDKVIVSPNSKNFKMQDDFLLSKDGKDLYRYICTGGSSLQIPEGVETIKSNSICGSSNDTIEVILPKSVKTLEINCFPYIYQQEFQFVIPKNVKFIAPDNYRFVSDISKDNKYYTMENGVIYNKDKTTLFYVGSNVKDRFEIPSGVETIVHRAFADCFDAYIVIPKSVKWFDCDIARQSYLDWLRIEFEDDVDKWYITANEDDWLKRQNGVPLSVILQDEISHFDGFNTLLVLGICYGYGKGSSEQTIEQTIEYATWYDPKIFDIERIEHYQYVENHSDEYENLFEFYKYMIPYFYKLD